MKTSNLLPFLLTPSAAMAGKGGGAALLGIIVLPLLIWGVFKIWAFWLRLIFGGARQPPGRQLSNDAGGAVTRPTRECSYCAELILAKAKKCKHCGSDVH